MRTTFLPYHVPSIGEAEISAVVDVMQSGWLTTGPRTREFEQQFARAVGAKHALAVNSCTAALHLALEAVGVTRDDEVIVPTLTFAATAEVVTYLGAVPVLVDSQPDTGNMDPAAVERAITPRTRAIVPVHFAGQPCDMDELMAIGRRHDIKIIEDAAHSLPATYRGQSIGRLGDITCFSFYATKTLTTGEGGMITTDDDAAADRMKIMALHGISRDAWKRYTAEGSWYYEILHAGFKYNLTDIASAIGLAQLARQEEFLRARAMIARRYSKAFAAIPEVRGPICQPDRSHAWHLYVIEVDVTDLRITRDQFIAALKAENIGTSVHFIPLHLHPYYRERFGYQPGDFPQALAAYQRMISLPIYPGMSDDDVDDVVAAVSSIITRERRTKTAAAGIHA